MKYKVPRVYEGFTAKQLLHKDIDSFVAIGIFFYLVGVDNALDGEDLNHWSETEDISEIGEGLQRLVEAGLVESINEDAVRVNNDSKEICYKAVSLSKSNGLNHDDLDKVAKLSWLAMGIYQHLLFHGSRTILELSRRNPGTPFAIISKGLDELIELELVAEVLDTEVAEAINGGGAR